MSDALPTGAKSDAPDSEAVIRAEITALRDSVAALASHQDLSADDQAEVRRIAQAAYDMIERPPVQIRERLGRNEGRVDGLDRRLDALPPPASVAPSGVVGIVREGSTQARATVEGLSDKAFWRLFALGGLAIAVLLTVALLLFARNSGYNVTTSGTVNVRDARTVEAAPGGEVDVFGDPEVGMAPRSDGIPPPPPYSP